MKIFNWVHRRFNHVSLKDDIFKGVTSIRIKDSTSFCSKKNGELIHAFRSATLKFTKTDQIDENFVDDLARNAKRVAEEFTCEADKQALLKQVALVDVLEGWKDRILTIGTLGFDPVKPSNQQNAYLFLGSEAEKAVAGEEEEAEDSIEEERAQKYSVERDNDKKNIVYDENDQICFEDEEEEVNPLILTGAKRLLEESDTNDLIPVGVSSNVPEIICDQKKNKGVRVTLAELFLAESDDDMAKKKELLGGLDDQPRLPGKKPDPCSKNRKWFAKKLIAHGPEDSQPIKKLDRLMRKMLRRKIHPELEGKGCKLGDQKKPNAELAFLLPNSSGATI